MQSVLSLSTSSVRNLRNCPLTCCSALMQLCRSPRVETCLKILKHSVAN